MPLTNIIIDLKFYKNGIKMDYYKTLKKSLDCDNCKNDYFNLVLKRNIMEFELSENR